LAIKARTPLPGECCCYLALAMCNQQDADEVWEAATSEGFSTDMESDAEETRFKEPRKPHCLPAPGVCTPERKSPPATSPISLSGMSRSHPATPSISLSGMSSGRDVDHARVPLNLSGLSSRCVVQSPTEVASGAMTTLVSNLRRDNALLREKLMKATDEVERLASQNAMKLHEEEHYKRHLGEAADDRHPDFAHLLALVREFREFDYPGEMEPGLIESTETEAQVYHIGSPRAKASTRTLGAEEEAARLRSELAESRNEVACLRAELAQCRAKETELGC